MSIISDSPSRNALLAAIVAHKTFKMRLPTAGLWVKPVYLFEPQALQSGTIIGVVYGQGRFAQLEIVQVMREHMWTSRDRQIQSRYSCVLFHRLSETGRVTKNIAVAPTDVLCVFEPTTES